MTSSESRKVDAAWSRIEGFDSAPATGYLRDSRYQYQRWMHVLLSAFSTVALSRQKDPASLSRMSNAIDDASQLGSVLVAIRAKSRCESVFFIARSIGMPSFILWIQIDTDNCVISRTYRGDLLLL